MKWRCLNVVADNKLGVSQNLGTFYVNDNGEVDEYNLPSENEMINILKALQTKIVTIEESGTIED